MTYGMTIKCPKCGKTMRLDKIERNFNGNQNEKYFCEICDEKAIVKVRYGRVVKTEHIDKNEKMTIKWGCFK